MFLCDECHEPSYCLAGAMGLRSHGKCEGCDVVAACTDCHSDNCGFTKEELAARDEPKKPEEAPIPRRFGRKFNFSGVD